MFYRRGKLPIRLLSAMIVLFLMIPLSGCQAPHAPIRSETEIENLIKLCRVWGYVKYTHPAFLLGQKDWDEELLELIPQVRGLKTDTEVNDLLHDWFLRLGETDCGEAGFAPVLPRNEVILTDTSWTASTAYLGAELSEDLGKLADLPYVDHARAPIRWDDGVDIFGNEGMPPPQYEDPGFRLLGLFRLWNAMEYYFPYKDYLDQDWTLYLEEYIPRILDGTDRNSYEMAIATLAFQLHDPHVWFEEPSPDGDGILPLFSEELGYYFFPVPLSEAEGQLVVSGTAGDCPLERGDVLLALNGTDMEQLVEERRQYEGCPREDAVINRMRYTTLTRSQTESMDVTVLRGGKTLQFPIKCCLAALPEEDTPQASYQLLDGGIGLIHLSLLDDSEISEAMNSFRGTKGLIIDLREYPEGFLRYGLSAYFQLYTTPFLTCYHPSRFVPGAYTVEHLSGRSFGCLPPTDAYHYDKPVVVLMNNDRTQSNAEYFAAMFSLAENVTLMGENSAGAAGGMVYLPLPGNLRMAFSFERATRPDGTCWFQTGITPDIYVPRTIQGIAEGRDEVMEAAVQYIMDIQQIS